LGELVRHCELLFVHGGQRRWSWSGFVGVVVAVGLRCEVLERVPRLDGGVFSSIERRGVHLLIVLEISPRSC
jgi:hypothetical protein